MSAPLPYPSDPPPLRLTDPATTPEKRLKVGVLTFHGSVNPGAFWQTYATCQLLESMGHEAEVIDYRHPGRHRRGLLTPARKLRAWQRPDLLFRVCMQRYYAGLSRRELKQSPQIDTAADLENLAYDAIVVGSDVVWDRPIDPVYWGRHLKTERLIAYAASAGSSRAEVGDLPEELKAQTPFTAISVRDANTLELLKRGHPSWSRSAQLLSDPTVTLAVPEICRRRPIKGKYIMVYCSQRLSRENRRRIQTYAREHHLKVVAVFYRQRGFSNHVCVTAFDWMAYLLHAELVVTDTFHGTVLSCLNQKPVAVINMSPGTLLKSQEQFLALGVDVRMCQARGGELVPLTEPNAFANVKNLADRNRAFLKEVLG